MGTLYLHIGTPKTGTTMLQHFMSDNRELLRGKGYSFPNFGFRFDGIGRGRNGHFLIHRYFDEKGDRLYDREKELQSEGMKILMDELSQYKNVVLSEEGIWNSYQRIPGFWEKLNARVTEAGHILKVIVYLRRQDSYIQSYWAQRVKVVSRLSFQQFLSSEAIKHRCLDYEKGLRYIANGIGQENIIVRPFEKGQFTEASLPADFLNVLGLSLTEEYMIDKEIVNTSISGKYLEVKRILNTMPEYQGKMNFIIPLLYQTEAEDASCGGKENYFKLGQAARFMKRFEESNNRVAREYLHRDGSLFMEEIPDGGEHEGFSAQELVLACGRMLLKMQDDLEASNAEQRKYRDRVQELEGGIIERILHKIKNRLKGVAKRQER